MLKRDCKMSHMGLQNTVEPRYNEVLGTMKMTLLYQVSHYIGVKKQRNIKSWDQQNHLVIRGFCYIRPLYNEVPLYKQDITWKETTTAFATVPYVSGQKLMPSNNQLVTYHHLDLIILHCYNSLIKNSGTKKPISCKNHMPPTLWNDPFMKWGIKQWR